MFGAAHTGRADPATPQLDAAHLQREDAQRIDQQQRRVDANAPSLDAEVKPQPPAPPDRPSRTTGFVLIGAGATAAVLSTAFFASSVLDDTEEHPTRNTVAALLGVAAATAVVAGVAILVTGRGRAQRHAMLLAPMASPASVGLAAVGRF